ncbi:MAG: HYR domain-containing protein [Flavobacteriales bacterium]
MNINRLACFPCLISLLMILGVYSNVRAQVISGMPENITISNDVGVCGALVIWPQPTVEKEYTLTSDYSPGELIPVGLTTITYVAENDQGQTETSSFQVEVQDTEAPVFIESPADITVPNDVGDCGAVVAWVTPTATDNCNLYSIESSHTPSEWFPVGSHVVTYEATDISGNVVFESFVITVFDTENPMITCLDDVIVSLDDNCSYSLEDYTSQIEILGNNCPNGLSVTQSLAEGTQIFTNTEITLTATDSSGNQTSCTFMVFPVDDTEPEVPVLEDIISQGEIVLLAPLAYDLCAGTIVGTTADPIIYAEPGTYVVTWIFTDLEGNFSVAVQNVTIEESIAMEAICLDISVMLDETGMASIAPEDLDGGTVLNDESSIFSISQDTFDCNSVGINTVMLTAFDSEGNTSTCASIVTVEDLTLPTAICQNISVETDTPEELNITAAQLDMGSYDNCGFDLSVSMVNSVVNEEHIAMTYMLTATDYYGNSDQCVSEVIVTETSLGLPDLHFDQYLESFELYPNPATSDITIEGNGAELGAITILNATGKEVLRINTEELKTQIEIDELPAGMYFIECNSKVKRFIKR